MNNKVKKKKKNAKNHFENECFKLMDNNAFRKAVENVGKHRRLN